MCGGPSSAQRKSPKHRIAVVAQKIVLNGVHSCSQLLEPSPNTSELRRSIGLNGNNYLTMKVLAALAVLKVSCLRVYRSVAEPVLLERPHRIPKTAKAEKNVANTRLLTLLRPVGASWRLTLFLSRTAA